MQPNNNGFFGIKVSQPGVNVGQANANQLLYQNDYNTEAFYDGGGNPRVLIGTLPDGSYGLWVSAPGVNASTANPSVPGQLVFNSNTQTFNVADTNSITLPATVVPNTGTTFTNVTVEHGLGFTPIVQANLLTDVGISATQSVLSYIPLPIFNLSPGILIDFPVTAYSAIYVTADSENIYFTAFYLTDSGPGQGGTVPALIIQYFLVSTTTT